MKLEPLYRVRFTYPESWAVGLDGGWQQVFFIAEGMNIRPIIAFGSSTGAAGPA